MTLPEFTDPRPLVAFLVKLAQEDVPVGRIEEILEELDLAEPPFVFENGYLGQWAADAADRLELEVEENAPIELEPAGLEEG